MFGDGEVANIFLSLDEAKAIKFLEDVVRKPWRSQFWKIARKGKAPSDEILEDISASVDKGSRANFWGRIRYL